MITSKRGFKKRFVKSGGPQKSGHQSDLSLPKTCGTKSLEKIILNRSHIRGKGLTSSRTGSERRNLSLLLLSLELEKLLCSERLCLIFSKRSWRLKITIEALD